MLWRRVQPQSRHCCGMGTAVCVGVGVALGANAGGVVTGAGAGCGDGVLVCSAGPVAAVETLFGDGGAVATGPAAALVTAVAAAAGTR